VRTALNQEKTAAKMVADDPTRLHRVDELSPAVLSRDFTDRRQAWPPGDASKHDPRIGRQ
jgi:hypothetical protein